MAAEFPTILLAFLLSGCGLFGSDLTDTVASVLDKDGDGYDLSTDCDDDDWWVSPGADEYCNGKDDDCDGEVDEAGARGGETLHLDLDGDGFGDPDSATTFCEDQDGWVDDASDCDDEDETINPDGEETCNHVDDDCDDQADENPPNGPVWYRDQDGDGYGDASYLMRSCLPPSGYVSRDDDCDDGDADTHPGADELCDGIDNDCDEEVDEDCDGQADALPADQAYGTSERGAALVRWGGGL